MKSALKSLLIKLCKRIGETSPILIDFASIHDAQNASLLMDSMRFSKFLDPQTLAAPQNKKILIIAPHPDDEVIGMGGTLLQMIDNKCAVEVISLTFGYDAEAKKEAEKAAAAYNYSFIHFFDFKTKHITLTNDTISEFSELINHSNPDIIFIPFMLDDHDDHRRASELLLKAYDKDLIQNPEHKEIWAYQVYTALPLNVVVNITDVIDKKLESISHYNSRFSQRHWAHFAMGINAMNVRFLNGNKNQDYAEVFFKTSLKNYIKMCRTYFKSPRSCYSSEHYRSE